MIYLVYDIKGMIIQKSTSLNETKGDLLVSIVPEASGYVTTTDDSVEPQTHRINLTTLQPEPKTNIPVSSQQSSQINTSLLITGLPECEVAFDEDSGPLDISDGTLDFTTDLAGEYSLVFTSPLYLDTTTVITVTD